MSIENIKIPTQKEVSEIQEERDLSDAELVKEGAEVTPEGRIIPTDEQIKIMKLEMEEDIAKKNNETQEKNKKDELFYIKKIREENKREYDEVKKFFELIDKNETYFVSEKYERQYNIKKINDNQDYIEINVTGSGVKRNVYRNWEADNGTRGLALTKTFRLYKKSQEMEELIPTNLSEDDDKMAQETDKAAFLDEVVTYYAGEEPSPGFWYIDPKNEEDLEIMVETINDKDTVKQIKQIYKEKGGPVILAGEAYSSDNVPERVIKRARASLQRNLQAREKPGYGF